MSQATIESFARVSLYSAEMNRRFRFAPRYAENKITPDAKFIRAIYNYIDSDKLEADTSLGYQCLDSNCYLVAVEEPDSTISGFRYLMPEGELLTCYHPAN